MGRDSYTPRHMRPGSGEVHEGDHTRAELVEESAGVPALGTVRERPRGMLPDLPGAAPLQVAFVIVSFLALVAPLALMPLVRTGTDSEKRELAPAPRLMADDGFNLHILEDAGAYFADHFAFRDELIDLDATIKQSAFLTSATRNVVVGKSGWLYYAGELGDYRRSSSLSDAALEHAAYNLSLMQEYVESQGKHFALLIAPNKSTVYPQHMPYYQVQGTDSSTMERLLPLLAERGVHVVDVSDSLGSSQEVLYFARDSHWNDAGALVAYGELMRALGIELCPFGSGGHEPDEHAGDLDGMLHPVLASPEEQQRPTDVDAYELLGDAQGVEDSYLATQSTRDGARGTLLMYRDSFANNLIPPLASTYAQAAFTKRIPYDMGEGQIGFAQDVVVERAERHLSFFATDPPYMPAPLREITEVSAGEHDSSNETASDSPAALVGESTSPGQVVSPDEDTSPDRDVTSVYAQVMGPYLMVDGTLATLADAKGAQVYAQLCWADGTTRTYACFRVSDDEATTSDFEGQGIEHNDHVVGDGGYRCYVPVDVSALPTLQRVRILVGTSGGAHEVASLDIKEVIA